jgi:hypothetical protein
MSNLEQFVAWRDHINVVMHPEIWWQGFVYGALIGGVVGCSLGVIGFVLGFMGTGRLARMIDRSLE